MSFFEIQQLFHQTRFTEKIQIRAFTLDDLVGSCGGFIGLFLGYALVQIPQLIEFVMIALKRKVSEEKLATVQIRAINTPQESREVKGPTELSIGQSVKEIT